MQFAHHLTHLKCALHIHAHNHNAGCIIRFAKSPDVVKISKPSVLNLNDQPITIFHPILGKPEKTVARPSGSMSHNLACWLMVENNHTRRLISTRTSTMRPLTRTTSSALTRCPTCAGSPLTLTRPATINLLHIATRTNTASAKTA